MHGCIPAAALAAAGHHAGPGDGLEELLDLGGAGDELVLPPELERGVLDELDEEAPRVRPVHDQALQEQQRDPPLLIRTIRT